MGAPSPFRGTYRSPRAFLFGVLVLSGLACGRERIELASDELLNENVQALSTAEGIPCDGRAFAVTANTGDVTIVNANALVDSYALSRGSYGGDNVGSLGSVRAAGAIVNNGGTIKGALSPHTAANLVTVPVPAGARNLPLGATTPGDLNINGTDRVTLAPGSYVVGSVNFNYPGAIDIQPAGEVKIWVMGNLNLGGMGNANGLPANLTFLVVGSGTVNVNSGGALMGSIYAPSSTVHVNSAVFGWVVGGSVTLNTGAAVHYPVESSCGGTPCEVSETTALIQACAVRCVTASHRILGLGACKTRCQLSEGAFRVKAAAVCLDDPDHDGVAGPADLCAETPRYTPVNQDGCTDVDQDGIAEPGDQCPGTPFGARVTGTGCPVDEACQEGSGCSGQQPAPTSDRGKEVAIATTVSAGDLKRLGEDLWFTGPHVQSCPEIKTGPSAPRVTIPNRGFTSIDLPAVTGHPWGVAVTLADGKVADGDKVTLSFAWEPSSAACPPLRYSVFVEYYHCHTVDDVDDLAAYVNAGWCRWMPYRHETVTGNSYQVDFDIGRVLYELHLPFAGNLGWTPPVNGPFTVRYLPQWLRARVLAHDGNGRTSSADGLEHYYVLHTGPLDTRFLTGIPVSPF